MKLEKKSPQTWKVPVVILKGKITEILSSKKAESSDKEGDFTELDVFVFSAELEYIGHRRTKKTRKVWHAFKDVESGLVFRFSHTTLEDFIVGLVDGRISLSLKDGTFTGHWTFRSLAGTIACGPVTVREKQLLGL